MRRRFSSVSCSSIITPRAIPIATSAPVTGPSTEPMVWPPAITSTVTLVATVTAASSSAARSGSVAAATIHRGKATQRNSGAFHMSTSRITNIAPTQAARPAGVRRRWKAIPAANTARSATAST